MLDRYPMLNTKDFDLAREVHEALDLDLRLQGRLPRKEIIITRANALETPDLGLYGYYYSQSMTLNAVSGNRDYWLAVPLARSGGKVTPRIARLASPNHDDPLNVQGAQHMVGLRLGGGAVRKYAETFLGEAPPSDFRFAPVCGRPSAADAFIAHRLGQLLAHEKRGPLPIEKPPGARRLLEAVVEALLIFHDHPAKALVRCAGLAPAPRDVKRALDYIHAHADQNPDLATLAAIADVPGRTLRAHFRAFVGASPVDYVRRVRLQNVRMALLQDEAESVGCAAQRQGFAHMGRFAADYAKAFGEPPSKTLRRPRRVFRAP